MNLLRKSLNIFAVFTISEQFWRIRPRGWQGTFHPTKRFPFCLRPCWSHSCWCIALYSSEENRNRDNDISGVNHNSDGNYRVCKWDNTFSRKIRSPRCNYHSLLQWHAPIGCHNGYHDSVAIANRDIKGCVSLDPSKISKSGWWGLQLDTWQLCNSLWYGLINSKLLISIKKIFFYITQHQTVSHVQCFKSPSWPLRDGLDLWPQLIYTLSWESQHEEI